ncbi:MAG: YbaB/EbfC family nucleoid-associated protein [Verrucomicrobiales bacterium]|nr:YbaB/EbfC family nucleoid-associated protein [Verrucomicrobiales bacterium]|tara:strand:- start:12407 stop:12733 length:327 start_codon:yes stop_codon:yes gene_type:complete
MMKGFGNMMKQAQEMQSKLESLQKELEQEIVEGASGGGMVKATATAKGVLKSLAIDDELFKQDEKEILEDLVVAAVNDAKTKGEKLSQEKMSAISGGLNLPGGMKLPF